MLLIENARFSFIPVSRHIDLAKKKPENLWWKSKGILRKEAYSNNNDRRNEDPVDIGFCFGCTSKTFSNNMHIEKHYFLLKAMKQSLN